MEDIQSVKLSNGQSMPAIGLGTWQVPSNEVKDAVRVALDTGYRLIDTASVYGNEQGIGEALSDYFQQGRLKRSDVFITTKLFCTHLAKTDVKPAFEDSLAKLGLDYIDLYLIHAPFGLKNKRDGTWFPVGSDGKIEGETYDLLETWKEMEDLVRAGKIRSIGVCSFNSRLLTRICDNATIMPVINQVECHAYLQQRPLQEFCSSKGIALTAFSPLGSPGVYKHSLGENTILPLDDPVVKATAARYKKTPAQILIRYLLQRKIVVIPKSVTPSRIQENFQVIDFEISEDDMSELERLDKHMRLFDCKDMLHCHPEYPRKDLF